MAHSVYYRMVRYATRLKRKRRDADGECRAKRIFKDLSGGEARTISSLKFEGSIVFLSPKLNTPDENSARFPHYATFAREFSADN